MPSIAETVDPASITRIHASHQAIELDYVGGTNVIYVGWAAPGTPTSASLWRIAKLTYDGNNNPTSMLWATGDNLYDKVWDNRAGYAYS